VIGLLKQKRNEFEKILGRYDGEESLKILKKMIKALEKRDFDKFEKLDCDMVIAD